MEFDLNPLWNEVDRAVAGNVELDLGTTTRVSAAPSAAAMTTTATVAAHRPSRSGNRVMSFVEPCSRTDTRLRYLRLSAKCRSDTHIVTIHPYGSTCRRSVSSSQSPVGECVGPLRRQSGRQCVNAPLEDCRLGTRKKPDHRCFIASKTWRANS